MAEVPLKIWVHNKVRQEIIHDGALQTIFQAWPKLLA
jgi:hypothetical protein